MIKSEIEYSAPIVLCIKYINKLDSLIKYIYSYTQWSSNKAVRLFPIIWSLMQQPFLIHSKQIVGQLKIEKRKDVVWKHVRTGIHNL